MRTHAPVPTLPTKASEVGRRKSEGRNLLQTRKNYPTSRERRAEHSHRGREAAWDRIPERIRLEVANESYVNKMREYNHGNCHEYCRPQTITLRTLLNIRSKCPESLLDRSEILPYLFFETGANNDDPDGILLPIAF